MAKYNNYTRKLEDAFKKAQLEFEEAAYDVIIARNDRDKAYRAVTEKIEGENKIRRIRADRALTDAQNRFEEVKKTVWSEFDKVAALLTKQLEAEVVASNAVEPDAIDPNALELLKSDILNVEDFAKLANKYDDNKTMLRLISKYASLAAENSKNDDETRMRLATIAHSTRSGNNAVLRRWNEILDVAKTLSGQSHRDSSPEYVMKMNGQWDKILGAVIEEF